MATVSNHLSHDHSLRNNGSRHSVGRLSGSTAEVFPVMLDCVHRRITDQQIEEPEFRKTLDDFILALRQQKLRATKDEWQTFVLDCRRHPLMNVLQEDPFTHRAYSRPRGYAGDAALLDFIYGREEMWAPPHATPLGRRIFDYTTLAPAPEGVLARRGFIAHMIDQLAEEIRDLHILSIAAGHLREANLSAAVKRRKIGRFVALDADPLSLEEVARCYACFRVETVEASIRQLLTERIEIGSFDYVYSLGLFDYLGEATSRRLVWTMFQMLRPGGRLLVANFLPHIRDVGYMEVYMDWHLIYRTRSEMIQITMEIPQPEIKDITIFAEENQNIIFLEVAKN